MNAMLKEQPSTRIDPQVGQTYRDNDPRPARARTIKIEEIVLPVPGSDAEPFAWVIANPSGKRLKVLLRRLHTDGRKRNQGYNLITSE